MITSLRLSFRYVVVIEAIYLNRLVPITSLCLLQKLVEWYNVSPLFVNSMETAT
jgi:hypothetical protein